MEFTAECRLDRTPRRHRPGNVPGLVAALAGLGVLAALSGTGYEFAADTVARVTDMAEAGFSPETRAESVQLARASGQALLGVFLFALAASALWLIIKDLARNMRRAGTSGVADNGARHGPMAVRFGDEAAEISSDLTHVSVDWAAVDGAARSGDEVVLTLANGAAWRIPASAAPGGVRGALDAARAAIAGRAAGGPA